MYLDITLPKRHYSVGQPCYVGQWNRANLAEFAHNLSFTVSYNRQNSKINKIMSFC